MFSEELLQRIVQEKATLKIITKTKNERFFIEKWIQHHLAIIGDGKLIIFDNMSDDQHVLDVYEKYKDHILLIKFDFFCDLIHDYFIVKDFYDAISKSCNFFTVLDSDEFLYFYGDNDTIIHDNSILNYLKENTDCDFFAPCWLDNREKEENILYLASPVIKERVELTQLFNWGKVIANSNIVKKADPKNPRNVRFQHTFMLPLLNYTKAQTKFFIAHRKNLDVQQRIATNMNKLVSFDVLSHNTDFEGLFQLKPKDWDKTIAHLNLYIEQTQRLLQGHTAIPDLNTIPASKMMELGKDNKAHFPSKFTKQAFSHLLNSSYLDLIHYDYSKIDNPQSLTLAYWIENNT